MLPRKVYFTADTEMAGFFMGLINKVRSELWAGEGVQVEYLDQLMVSKFVMFDKEIVRDPFIAVEALLAAKIMSQK